MREITVKKGKVKMVRWLGFGLAILPGLAIAGVVEGDNPFVQHAVSQAPFGTTPGVPANPPSAPNLPTSTGNPSEDGPFVPPGAAATGFSPVQHPQTTVGGVPETVVHSQPVGPTGPKALDGYNPFPNAKPGARPVLPPALPSAERTRNAALAQQTPGAIPSTIPVAPPRPPENSTLKAKYIPANATRPASQEILVSPGSLQNIVVNVSGFAPNILVTPFHHPILIFTDANAVRWSPYGDRMIISVYPEHPVGVVVTGEQKGDPTISMTLVPQKEIGRNYKLIINGWHPNPAKVSAQLNESRRNAHFLSVMKAAALGSIPSGYVRSSHLPGVQEADHLRLTPYARYDGGRYTLTEYRVVNETAAAMRLVESDFYQKGVVAVTFWPSGELQGNGSTRLFVLAHRGNLARHGVLGFVGKE